ncbi:MAG TPA: tripartite tricarboxylate transporter substrate binding protein, partial [Burkholderiales bacterium]|nr:tripartite tricarboxylate transporter substrate binding protein [Burkholderiales bacterium]
RICNVAIAAVAMLSAAACACAQDFPPRQIVIVVGFPAGGGTDLFARVYAQKLAVSLATTVIVDNRPGAAGTVGTALVTRAAPTGQTLLFTPSNLAMTQALYTRLPFDARKDLTPITIASRIPFVLVIHPALPAHNVLELLSLARAKPGALDYGSSGPGSPPHLAMELLKSKTGVDIHHIPYKGAGPILNALLSGEVQASFLIPPLALQYMKSGKMRGLAVTTRERSAALPDLPALREAGAPDYEVTQWHAFFAPAKTPAAIVNRINLEMVKVLGAPDVRQRLAGEGAEVVASSGEELGTFLASEIQLYSELVQRLGLKVD